jgi:acyl-CoA synthetase (NDP forming)
LPTFSATTRRALRRALPDYASQNNPLDVTGQAAVETDMFRGALDALAHDPAVGLIAFDAFPPRLEDEDVWAEPVLRTVRELQRSTRVAFASVAMSALSYGPAARRFVGRAGLPFLQGHRPAAAAIRALVDLQDARPRSVAEVPPHPNRAIALRTLRGLSGALDEEHAGRLLELYGVRRPRGSVVNHPRAAAAAARSIGFPVAVKALAPEMPHKAKLGGVRLGLADAAEVEAAGAEVLAAARRARAKAPKLLVQRMANGAEVLVGAVVDERFGALVTLRPGGQLAERGEASFVPAPLTRAQARRYVAERAAACGLDALRHDLGGVARAVEAVARAANDLRGRLVSLEANPLLVGERGAVAVDALAEVSGSGPDPARRGRGRGSTAPPRESGSPA